jgi:hypothetical protein
MPDPDDPPTPPPASQSARQRRLAEALRANLTRRKAQKRARAGDEAAATDEQAGEPGDRQG